MTFYVQSINVAGEWSTFPHAFADRGVAVERAGDWWAAHLLPHDRAFTGIAHRVVDGAGRVVADPLQCWTDPDRRGDPAPVPMTEEVTR